MMKPRIRFMFSSQLKFHFPQVKPYSFIPGSQVGHPEPLDGLSEHLYLQVYKPDSPRIAQQLNRLKVHRVQSGGTQFIYTDKAGLAVGVKGDPYQSGAKVCRDARSNGFGSVILVDSEIKDEALGKFMSGFLLANYKFKVEGQDTKQKIQDEMTQGRYQQIELLHLQEDHYKDPKLQEYIKLAYYKCYARELSNLRIEGDTTFFLKEVEAVYKDNPKVVIKSIVGQELIEQNLNLIHAVGRGSTQPPLMINLTYMGNKDDDQLHGFVGKGITFDTGGYHLKPYGSMEAMYLDKAGACAVLAAFRGAVEMKLKVNITVTLGFAENAIGNTSYKPSEIISSHKGLTVEINNTDAEGRLVLADCISWTQSNKNPCKMIEVSTLTGACMVALGENTGGLFCNNDQLSKQLIDISNDVGEPLWRLPVTDEHMEMMKGTSADLCNVGKGKVAGASKAAAFLFSFLDKSKNIPFAHLDIAGPMESKTDKGINSRGSTGFATTILLKYLIQNQK